MLFGCLWWSGPSVGGRSASATLYRLARFKYLCGHAEKHEPQLYRQPTLGGARDEVKTNFEQVKLTAQNVKNAKVAGNLETAYQDLDSTIQNIPETATLQQAMDSVSWQVAAVEAAPRSDGCRFELPLRNGCSVM